METNTMFQKVGEFEVIVPVGYVHMNCLEAFRRRWNGDLHRFDDGNITDRNFCAAATTLIPGQRFKVEMFCPFNKVSAVDCLDFLKSERSLLVSAQGVPLVYEQARRKILPAHRALFFDEASALWTNPSQKDQKASLASLFRHSEGNSYEVTLEIFDSINRYDKWGIVLSFHLIT